MTRILLALFALFFAAPALGAPSAPLPACGATVILTGDQGAWRPAPVRCPDDKRITYAAWDATFRSIYMLNAAGVTVVGGTVDSLGVPTAYRAVAIDSSQNVTIEGMTITGAAAGIVSTRSSNVDAIGNRLSGLGSDCIDYSGTQGGRVAFNQCYRAKMIGGEHPDGFQGVKTNGANSAITVERNRFFGAMEGVYFETGSAGSGIVVRDNEMTIDFANGVLINGAASADVSGNVVTPSAKAVAGGVLPWVKATATSLRACGNSAAAPSVSVGVAAC